MIRINGPVVQNGALYVAWNHDVIGDVTLCEFGHQHLKTIDEQSLMIIIIPDSH